MVHLERWFCRRNFHFTEVEVTERVISTLLPMEWKLLFHFTIVFTGFSEEDGRFTGSDKRGRMVKKLSQALCEAEGAYR